MNCDVPTIWPGCVALTSPWRETHASRMSSARRNRHGGESGRGSRREKCEGRRSCLADVSVTDAPNASAYLDPALSTGARLENTLPTPEAPPLRRNGALALPNRDAGDVAHS